MSGVVLSTLYVLPFGILLKLDEAGTNTDVLQSWVI